MEIVPEMNTFHLRGVGLTIIAIGLLVIPVSAAMDFTLSPDQPPISSSYNVTHLTQTGLSCDLAALSPDGTEIAMVCREWKQPYNCSSAWTGSAKTTGQLYLIRSDGSQQHKLSDINVYGVPQWNPKGDAIAISGSQDRDDQINASLVGGIWIIRTDRSQEQWVVNDSKAKCISWNPDGRYLAFTSNDGSNTTVNIVDTYNYDVSELYQLPHSRGFDEFSVGGSFYYIGFEETIKWSNDGKYLIFLSGENWKRESAQYTKVQVNIDGSKIEKTQIKTANDYMITEMAWNPSFSQFAYITNLSYAKYKNGIRIVDLKNETDVPISTDGLYRSVEWNSDGKNVIFINYGDIWEASVDGTDINQLTVNGSIRFLTGRSVDNKIIFSESVKITNCEPQLGYFGIGWPQHQKTWQNWTTASRIGVLDLNTPVRSSTSSPGFDILTVMCATGAAVLLARKRR